MNKIPKIIHYCWLSGEEIPENLQRCIDSWKVHMPDYELMLWDMKSFDINSVPFVRDACKAKKWAIASDYIRLHAVYKHGGVYLDSDILVYQSFDPFLVHSAFSGTQVNLDIIERQIREGSTEAVGIEPAIFGAEPGHPWVKTLLDYYGKLKFENTISYYRKNIMPVAVSQISHDRFGFKYMPIYQVLKDDVHVYPPDVFTINTPPSPIKYSTHFCANSWMEHNRTDYTVSEKIKIFIIDRLIGRKNWERLRK